MPQIKGVRARNVFDSDELVRQSDLGAPISVPKKDLIPPFQELERASQLEFRRPSFDGRGIASATIVNRTVNRFSRTYDAIVNINGGADFTLLEDAIKHVIAIGGGDIFVHAGTYTITKDISTLTVPINIIGTNSALTVIDFNSASRNFVANSGTPYTTGTITSATGTAVVGSSTAWLGNVAAGQYIFIRTKWYLIAAVIDNTNLVLAEAFDENFTTFPGASYRIATLTRGIGFDGVTIKNSTGTAIAFTDVRDINLNDVLLLANNKGFVFTNCSNITINSTTCATSTSNGWEMTNCGLLTVRGLASVGSGGHGGVMNAVEVGSFLACNSSANTNDGLNLTSVADVDLNYVLNSNGGQGAESVATNNNVSFRGGAARNNTSDGIKFTATSDYCKIINYHFDTNGGWGINNAASTNDKCVFDGNSFNGNVSGTITNSGTGTVLGDNTT